MPPPEAATARPARLGGPSLPTCRPGAGPANGLHRRGWLLAGLGLWGPLEVTLGLTLGAAIPARAANPDGPPEAVLRQAMQRAQALRDEALRTGDQPYGAVVLCGERIVGAAPSRVITATDPTAHAEMEALRDAARRLQRPQLSGCLLVSTSRPCRMCEAAAGWAGIARMVHGQDLTDAGAPR